MWLQGDLRLGGQLGVFFSFSDGHGGEGCLLSGVVILKMSSFAPYSFLAIFGPPPWSPF